MAGGSKLYWEISCPKCGKPSSGSIALNKVHPNSKGKVSNKVKCVMCKTNLKGD